MFLGSVMKAIACTPNANHNNEEYTHGVIAPAHKIREMMQVPGTEELSELQIKDVLSLLQTIFETKKVELNEREERLNDIIVGNGLQDIAQGILPMIRRSS